MGYADQPSATDGVYVKQSRDSRKFISVYALAAPSVKLRKQSRDSRKSYSHKTPPDYIWDRGEAIKR